MGVGNEEVAAGLDARTAPSRGKLSGNIGAVGLALTVMAFSAPLTVVSGYMPFSLGFGGVGSPLAFAFVSVMLLVFAVGYVTLNGIVKRPGDFYAFISFGIGKSFGLGSGLLAAMSYFLLISGTTSFFGVQCAEIHRAATGDALPWYVYSAGVWATVGILGYLHVELSAKVLFWVMMAEILVCVVFLGFVLWQGGDGSVSASDPFKPSQLLVNSPMFCMLFVVSYYGGFEATALFRDEVSNPERTIPRATYGAVLSIGVLYTLCAYAMVLAYGENIAGIAADSPGTMFSRAFELFVSGRFQMLIAILVLGSAFASILSSHNVLARYLHNLGTDGALPKVLGKAHVRHHSPYVASICVSVMVLTVLSPFIIASARPEILYGQLAGVSAAGVTALMTVVNFSAMIWYLRSGRNLNASFVKLFVCPVLSSTFFIMLLYVITQHFELLAGGEPGQHVWMLYVLFSIQFVGIVLAQWFKRFKPDIYDRLGRSRSAGG